MGVPAFFQWLKERYPTMMHEVLEGESLDKAEANAKEESRDPVQWCDHLYLCLLYTSPSPRDLSTSRMPSSA